MYGVFEVHSKGKDLARTEELIAAYMRRLGRDMCRLYGVDVEAQGLPPTGIVSGHCERGLGRIFVSNHRSGLDILVTLAHLQAKHVSRADLAGWPVIGLAARRAGILFVDRSSRRSSAAAVLEMIACVERGQGILLFAEGTTYSGDTVRPFKPGAFAVARRTSCEIIPVGIAYDGASASFEDESFLDHMRRVSGTARTRVGLAVGSAYRVEGQDTVEITAHVHAEVQRLVHEARALVSASRRPPT
jgi:1-acyl-sn-glycerol-3-phosphate acyltransferase